MQRRGVRRVSLLAFVGATSLLVGAAPARAALPTPRLVPDLSLSTDKNQDAAPEPDPWVNRKKSISLAGGSPGSPTGVAGLTLEYAPVKWIVLGAGGGYSPDGGPRGAFMPRLRLPLNHWVAVGMGFPFSLGPYQYTFEQPQQCDYAGCATGIRTTRTWSIATWGHLEPNVEFRVGPGVALRLFGGYGRVLNTQSDGCTSTDPRGCPSNIGEQKVYGGLTLGYAW